MNAMRKEFDVLTVGLSFVAVWLLGAGATRLMAQQSPTVVPTPLEAFAALPDAKTVWSKFIGRLDGATAYAIVSAVAFESATSTPKIRRGLSIELRHEGQRPHCRNRYVEWSVHCDQERAVVYIGESDLESVRARYVKERHAEVHAGHGQDLSSWWGSNGTSGLILFGYNLRERSVEEFAGLVAAAEDRSTPPRVRPGLLVHSERRDGGIRVGCSEGRG